MQNSRKIINCWFILLLISAVWTAIATIFIDKTLWQDLLFFDTLDSGMDHFNSMLVVGNKKPYSEYTISYPPLAAFFYYCFYYLLGKDMGGYYKSLYPGVEVREIREHSEALVPYILFLALCLILIAYMIFTRVKAGNRGKLMLLLCILFSCSMIYCIDRGNNVILVFVLLLFYILNYDSQNKFLSELAVISLAIATGLKLYPVAFGLLLIRDNKIAQGFRTVGYIVLAIIVPSFFFEGFDGLKIMFNYLLGVSESAEDVRYLNLASVAAKLEAVFSIDILDILISVISILFIVFGLLFSFTFEKKFKSILFASLAVIAFAGVSCSYMLLFIILPMITLINQKSISKGDFAYAVMFMLLNIPLVLPTPDFISSAGTTLVSLLQSFILLALMVMILADGAKSFVSYMKEKKWKKYCKNFNHKTQNAL